MAIGNNLLTKTGTRSARVNGALNIYRVVAADGIDANGKRRIKQAADFEDASLANLDIPVGISKDTVADTERAEYYAERGAELIGEAGALVSAGDKLTFDANGKLIALPSLTASEYAVIVGVAINAAAADGDLFTFIFDPQIVGQN